jgi:SAM-dependent MidA family methyltransferase
MLLLPGEMGERFKAMALTRGIEGTLSGFGFRDLSASL